MYHRDRLPFQRRQSLEHPSTPLVNLARHIATEPGIDLHLLSLHPHLAADCHFSENGCNYHLLRGGRFSLQLLTQYRLDRRKLVAELIRLRPDVVQAFGTEGPYGYAAVTSPFPNVVYLQGIVSELVRQARQAYNLDWVRLFMSQFVERYVVRRGKYFIAESRFSADFVRSQNPSASILMFPNLIRTEFFGVERSVIGLETDITFVGRVTESKGIFDLVEAFSELHGDFPDIRLKLIGPTDDEAERLRIERKLQQLNIGQFVLLAGMQSSEYIVRELESALMMVYPTHLDTSPNSVFEAMVAGVPVIATRVGGIPDMIEHNATGVLVAPRDPTALAQAMRFLLQNPDERRRLGDNARRVIRDRLDPGKTLQSLTDYYSDIVG
jgi:glycosyltransferase involved in cell wall biosynthesis